MSKKIYFKLMPRKQYYIQIILFLLNQLFSNVASSCDYALITHTSGSSGFNQFSSKLAASNDHVTSIDVIKSSDSFIMALIVNNINLSGWNYISNESSYCKSLAYSQTFSLSSAPNPITLTSTGRITKVIAYYQQSADYSSGDNRQNMCQITFQVSDQGINQNYNYIATAGCIKINTWVFTNKEFIGIYGVYGQVSSCGFWNFCVYQRSLFATPSACASASIQTIDVSSFDQKSLIIVTGSEQYYSIGATKYNSLAICAVHYQITVSGGTWNQLITLSGSTITFAATDELSYAGHYTIQVQAKTNGQTSWSAATTATFEYVNACLTASFVSTCWAAMTVNLNAVGSVSVPAWSDSLTNTVNNGTKMICAYTDFSQYVYSTTSTSNVTMATKFTYTNTPTTYTIRASPTLAAEAGIYVIRTQRCLVDAPSTCATCDTTVTVFNPCSITSVEILQLSPGGILTAQTWTISSSTQFTYQLAVNTATTCTYQPTSWTLTTTSTNNPGSASNFQTITAGGLFSTGTSIGATNAGIYNVSVSSVMLNGVVYSTSTSPSKITNTAASPNSFLFTVVDPCATTIVQPVVISDVSLTVWEGSMTQIYNSFSNFGDSASTTAGINNLCPLDYTATITNNEVGQSLTRFLFVPNSFQIYSSSMLQIGTYTVRVTGTVISHPTQSASTSFVIKITDPCLNTTIIVSSITPQNMTTSVNDGMITQQAPMFSDSVSVANGNGTGVDVCGARQYTIRSTPIASVSALTQAQLSIDKSSGLISVFTENSFNVGLHIATVSVQLVNYLEVAVTTLPFYIIIQPCNITILQEKAKVPFFNPPLSDQVVNQCPDYNGTLWNFKIPKPVDPNNGTVSIKVVMNPSYFVFEANNNKINQVLAPEKPTNQTIKIKLTDSMNATETYQMIVQFKCSKTTNFTFNLTQKINKTQTQWPTAYIKAIDADGLMHLGFNQIMKIPENSYDIQNQTVMINGTQYPILVINVTKGRLSDSKMLKFNWTFVSYDPSELKIQLNFENLQIISSHNEYPEKISVTVFGVYLFADVRANFMQPETILGPKILPQMISTAKLAQVQALASKAQQVITSAMVSNVVVSILVSGPLQQILGLIRQLQIIVHIMLIKLAYPASATTFFGMIMQVLTFQFYNFFDLYNQWLSLDNAGNSQLSNQFSFMGYGSFYIIQNFGTLCWLIFVTPFLWAVTPLIVAISKGSLQHLKQKVNRLMFWNNWIQFYNESYLFLGVCAALNYYYLHFDSYGNTINSVCAAIFGTIIIIFPFFVIVFYNLPKNYRKIKNNEAEFIERFGSAIEGLNFLRLGKYVILYPFLSCLRKLSLIYVVVFMQEKPIFSLFAINYQAIFMIMLVGYVPPFQDNILNRMEMINEVFVLMTNYHLFTFTEFQPDLTARENVGNSLIVVTLFNLLVNIGVITFVTCSISARQLKLKYLAWQQAQTIKAKMEHRIKKAVNVDNSKKLKKIQDQAPLPNPVALRILGQTKLNIPVIKHNHKQFKNSQVKIGNSYQKQPKINPQAGQSQKMKLDPFLHPYAMPFQAILAKKVLQEQEMRQQRETQSSKNIKLIQNEKQIDTSSKNLVPIKTKKNISFLTPLQVVGAISAARPNQIQNNNQEPMLHRKTEKDILREHLGLEPFIFVEIENGNLDRKLKEYAKWRQLSQSQLVSFRDSDFNDRFVDLGEFSPSMSLKEQGDLYYKILMHEDLLKRKGII